MRPRTDSRTVKSPAPLEKHFREIVVGSGRAQEPYVIAFHYASDNVSGSALGTLFGFFEVEIHDQDAAYIVNFLASVAKKEYFANPRRSPVESFEVALHKINVALAEIVKHGNISWLGHLHGAIGSVSQDTLHFSVTGEGEIYLAREEGLRSISTGLAEVENEPHPLKTFTEVSSGVLYDGDSIFALSPSIWSLFSPEDLRRNLNRLGPAGFEQFLRTALVNELPVAAVALVTCSAPVVLLKPEKTSAKPLADLDNVWSDAPFLAVQQSRETLTQPQPTSPEKAPREEYTDKKTGHIYVQATPATSFDEPVHPWKEQWTLFCHRCGNWSRSWGIALRKTNRRLGKESSLMLAALSRQLAGLRRSLVRKARGTKRTAENRWQHFREQRAARLAQTKTAEYTTPPSSESFVENEMYDATTGSDLNDRARPISAHPGFTKSSTLLSSIALSHRIRTSGNNIYRTITDLWTWIRRQFYSATTWISQRWMTLSSKQKWIALGCVLIIGSGVWLLGGRSTPPVITEETPAVITEQPATFPPANEPLATLLTDERSLPVRSEVKPLALTTINAKPYLITESSVVDLNASEVITTPEPLRLATAMDDLDALFILGQSNQLYLYSVTTKKFATNSLPLPAGAKIDAIGAYLTYLYVLDQKAGVIYRFPRAEGGFGAPVVWSKAPLPTGKTTAFSVFETIALTTPDGGPALYNRGKNTNVTFTGTGMSVTADVITFDPRSGDLLALDREAKRIVRWSTTGTLLTQYFHPSFENTQAFSVGSDNTLITSRSEGTFTFPLP